MGMRWGMAGMAFGAMMLLAGTTVQADSLLAIAPLRVMLDDVKTNEILSLTNRSEKTRVYKITMQDQVMDEQGNIVSKDDFPYSAKRMLRVMPRKVTLGPGQRQSLRVMVMPPEGLADGEYHTHLIFDEEHHVTTKDEVPTQGFKVELENQYSVGIPLIFNHGKVSGDLHLTGGRLMVGKNSRPEFHVALSRTGNGEASGVIKILEKGGNGESLVTPRSMHMYREADNLVVTLPTRDKLATTLQALQGQKLQVVLEKEGSKPETVDVTN